MTDIFNKNPAQTHLHVLLVLLGVCCFLRLLKKGEAQIGFILLNFRRELLKSFSGCSHSVRRLRLLQGPGVLAVGHGVKQIVSHFVHILV